MKIIIFNKFFFFSSRRRHTRWNCDWSSDVCSSDLPWTSLLGEGDELLRELPQLEALVHGLGLGRDDQIVTYCSYGPRATIGYAVLQHLGFKHVKVYDKSFQRWADRTVLSLDSCVSLT